MVINSLDVGKFISEKAYIDLIEDIKKITNIDINKSNPSVAIRDYCARDFNLASKLNNFSISLNDMMDLIANDKPSLIKFFIIHNELYNHIERNDADGEFPLNETPSVEEKGDVISIDPYPLSFMFGFIIRFYILKKNPEKINDYLKSLRIPNLKNYSRRILSAYSDAIRMQLEF